MGDKIPRNNAHCTIPDDPEQSTYRFIIVAAKRARQLQGGARPVLPTSSKKSDRHRHGRSAARIGEVRADKVFRWAKKRRRPKPSSKIR